VDLPKQYPVYDGPRRAPRQSPSHDSSAYAAPLSGAPESARTGSFARGGGVSADAYVSDERFRLAIHVGSGSASWRHNTWSPWWSSCSWYEPCTTVRPRWYSNACAPSWNYCEPSWWSCSYTGWGNNWGYWPSYYASYTYPVVNSATVMYPDPALSPTYSPSLALAATQATNAPVLSDFERATALMHDARYAEAATSFRAAVKADPGDAPARRWLGIALLLLGRTQDGSLEIARAYESDPGIADAAPDLEAMRLGVREMTDLCAPVITYARRVNSSSGYVAAAMLMQARSRPDLAAKMLDSARDAGLDSTLMVRLNQSMTR